MFCGGSFFIFYGAWYEGGGCLVYCRSLDSFFGGEGIELRLEGVLEGRKN